MAQIRTRDHATAARPLSQSESPSETLTTTEQELTRETTNSEYGDLEPEDIENNDATSPANGQNEKPTRPTRSSSRATGRDLQLSRTMSRRETVLSRIRTRPPIGYFSHPLENRRTTVDELVDFDGPDDPYRPLNWAMKKKVMTTALYGFTTMTATWASSAYSPGTSQVAEEFHVGTQTATLGTTLFLFAFGVSPTWNILSIDFFCVEMRFF